MISQIQRKRQLPDGVLISRQILRPSILARGMARPSWSKKIQMLRSRRDSQDKNKRRTSKPCVNAQKGQSKELGPPPGAMIDKDGSIARQEEEIQREVEKDSRVIKATRAWRTCMSGQGFGAMSRDQLENAIREKAAPFIDKYEASVNTERDEFRKSGADYWPGSDLRVADVLSPEELVELTNLQRYEMRAAAADLGCSKELNEVIGEVSKEKHAEPEVK